MWRWTISLLLMKHVFSVMTDVTGQSARRFRRRGGKEGQPYSFLFKFYLTFSFLDRNSVFSEKAVFCILELHFVNRKHNLLSDICTFFSLLLIFCHMQHYSSGCSCVCTNNHWEPKAAALNARFQHLLYTWPCVISIRPHTWSSLVSAHMLFQSSVWQEQPISSKVA